MEKTISAALKELFSAAKNMQQEIRPSVPMPRPRKFEICRSISADVVVEWPNIYDRFTNWLGVSIKKGDIRNVYWDPQTLAVRIVRYCNYQPRKILRALYRIQAATAWCEARLEGRKRAAEEILRQQQASLETLEAEAVLLAIKSTTPHLAP